MAIPARARFRMISLCCSDRLPCNLLAVAIEAVIIRGAASRKSFIYPCKYIQTEDHDSLKRKQFYQGGAKQFRDTVVFHPQGRKTFEFVLLLCPRVDLEPRRKDPQVDHAASLLLFSQSFLAGYGNIHWCWDRRTPHMTSRLGVGCIYEQCGHPPWVIIILHISTLHACMYEIALCMDCDRHCPTQKILGIAISDRDPVPLRADSEEPASYRQYGEQIRFLKTNDLPYVQIDRQSRMQVAEFSLSFLFVRIPPCNAPIVSLCR